MPKNDPVFDIGLNQRKKVLVAEDEPNIASLIEDWLSDTYEVIVCYNGKSAIQKAKWHKPHVILMDIVMPDIGGYEVVRALQADEDVSYIPIIAMTAKNYDDSTVKMIKNEKNVMGFINKPFRPDDLKKQIEKVMIGEKTFQAQTDSSPSVSSSPVLPPKEMPSASPSPLIEPTSPTPVPVSSPPLSSTSPVSPSPLGGETEPPTQIPSKKSYSPTIGASSMPPKEKTMAKESSEEDSHLADSERSLFMSISLGVLKFSAKSLIVLSAVVLVGEYLTRRIEVSLEDRIFHPPLRVSRLPELPYQFQSGDSWQHLGISFEINPWGLRDGEIPLIAEPDVYRIFLLGSSSLFGPGVSLSETVSKRLEKKLNKSKPIPGKKRYEVINGGAWGYSPEEQWAFYEETGMELKPHLLIWMCETKKNGYPNSGGLRSIAKKTFFNMSLFKKSRIITLIKESILRASQEGGTPLSNLAKQAETFTEQNKTSFLFMPFPYQEVGGVNNDSTLIFLDEEDSTLSEKDLKSSIGQKVLADVFYDWLIQGTKIYEKRRS